MNANISTNPTWTSTQSQRKREILALWKHTKKQCNNHKRRNKKITKTTPTHSSSHTPPKTSTSTKAISSLTANPNGNLTNKAYIQITPEIVKACRFQCNTTEDQSHRCQSSAGVSINALILSSSSALFVGATSGGGLLD